MDKASVSGAEHSGSNPDRHKDFTFMYKNFFKLNVLKTFKKY